MRFARPTRAAAVVAGLSLMTGCHTMTSLKEKAYTSARSLMSTSYDDPQAEAKVARAEQNLADAKYYQAEKLCRDVASNTYNPLLLAEKARFLEAESLKGQKKFPAAADTYHRCLVDFPGGAYRERACAEIFAIADYWLDDTRAEIKAEQEGRSQYLASVRRLITPDPTKPTLDQENRALQALDHVHTNDMTGPSADKALFWCGYVNFYRNNFQEADHYFSLLVEMHKDSPLRPLAIELAVVSKNNSTGGAVYDGQKAAEALQLVNHAEATVPEFRTEEKASFLTRQKMAIRMQQAEKDFKTAEYYERSRHPGSAYFCYELVRRRYPGTTFAKTAEVRMEAIRADAAAEPPATEDGSLKAKWDRLLGRPETEPEMPKRPAGGSPPASNLPGN